MRYKTFDLLIASTLAYNNFNCDLAPDASRPSRFWFIFEYPEEEDESFQTVVKSFWRGDLLVEPRRFYSIVKELKGRTKDSYGNV